MVLMHVPIISTIKFFHLLDSCINMQRSRASCVQYYNCGGVACVLSDNRKDKYKEILEYARKVNS